MNDKLGDLPALEIGPKNILLNFSPLFLSLEMNIAFKFSKRFFAILLFGFLIPLKLFSTIFKCLLRVENYKYFLVLSVKRLETHSN